MSDGAEEEVLSGGLFSEVLRVGPTVRRPFKAWTPTVHALLRHLQSAGFNGAPRVLGVDEKGREVLEYIPGTTGGGRNHHRLLGNDEALARAGRLLRAFHDAVAGFVPPADSVWQFPELERDAEPWGDVRSTIVCHNDAGAHNLIVGPERWAFIDWDFAGPRPFIWDLACSLLGIIPLAPPIVAPHLGWREPFDVTHRLAVFVDAYGLGAVDRAVLPDAILAYQYSIRDFSKRQAEAGLEPWASQANSPVWERRISYAREHMDTWTAALTGTSP
jgi:phosphotransferase family enzyme